MEKKILFLTLNVFSVTGGIEKVCRIAGKALSEIATDNKSVLSVFSMYDRQSDVDDKYLPGGRFRGFNGYRVRFVLAALSEGRRADVVILSHINLLPVAYLIKKIFPKTKLLLLTHGIEVWEPLSSFKKKMLSVVDLFLPVSRFTADKLKSQQQVSATKIIVLNNCLDPFLEEKKDVETVNTLKKKYGFTEGDFVLLTLTRLKSSEQYKGYDRVVQALATLSKTHPQFKYLLAGRYDKHEKDRLEKIIRQNKMDDYVVMAGYVDDDVLAAHFHLADVYIMPSTGEGFGVVFIEAMFYGKPVIAGNADGSVDALADGKLGTLIAPHQIDEIACAILQSFRNKKTSVPDRDAVMELFSFDRYKEKWTTLLFPSNRLKGTEENLASRRNEWVNN